MPTTRMLINYAPGDECRIAITEDGNLEEFFAEKLSEVSRVGNIYVAKVQNVEESIQAAFVDFGIGVNAFLHVSDIHPRYFPGATKDASERVGHKTPRRERPPIQKCLKRGQEVLVQVIKEGVGSKGPTVTSYLSVPGRFLVMMPNMDNIGVSRKVEDEDTRKKMRQILDTLDLPEGFGFILRTAGFDRTKAELKRDLSYLQRLWKDMERKRKKGSKPRLLYSESDLLLRTLRDQLTSEIEEVVIDSDVALDRASKFIRLVAPRSTTKLRTYTGKAPLFHAFNVEAQIASMHAREVPLPSGGRLVIDETEALVAIDVNSGRSRSARDAETNAYKTNLEAVDEICRQLRLRDLGGLVIHDLIDMRDAKHRRAIESRYRERLKRDRAKSTVLPISSFGILEMTRQRMRGSHEKQHFADCPTCHGRGMVQKPTSVAADALRELSATLLHEKVQRVELVVSGRVAGELLSGKRQTLGRIEHASGKVVDVRVSDAIPVDRFTLYAYDGDGSDVDITRLPKINAEKLIEAFAPVGGDDDYAMDLESEREMVAEEAAAAGTHEPTLQPFEIDDGDGLPPLEDEDDDDAPRKKKRRRRGRRRKRGSGEGDQQDGAESTDQDDIADDRSTADRDEADGNDQDRAESDGEDGTKKKRRRRRRRRKSGEGAEASESGSDRDERADRDEGDASGDSGTTMSGHLEPEASENDGDDEPAEGAVKKKRSRRRRRRKSDGEGDEGSERGGDDAEAARDTRDSRDAADAEEATPAKKKTRSRSKKAGTAKTASKKASSKKAATDEDRPKPVVKKAVVKKPRTLYGSSRRKLAPSERARLGEDA